MSCYVVERNPWLYGPPDPFKSGAELVMMPDFEHPLRCPASGSGAAHMLEMALVGEDMIPTGAKQLGSFNDVRSFFG
jgi:hypothetical protein